MLQPRSLVVVGMEPLPFCKIEDTEEAHWSEELLSHVENSVFIDTFWGSETHPSKYSHFQMSLSVKTDAQKRLRPVFSPNFRPTVEYSIYSANKLKLAFSRRWCCYEITYRYFLLCIAGKVRSVPAGNRTFEGQLVSPTCPSVLCSSNGFRSFH